MIDTCSPHTRQDLVNYLRERFGIDESLFDGYAFYTGPHGRLFLGPQEAIDVAMADTTGILIARIQKSIKPSSLFFQVFGSHVTRNVIHLSTHQAQDYIRGREIALSSDAVGETDRGYVMVGYRHQPLGCGLLKGRTLTNVLPKRMRMNVSHL